MKILIFSDAAKPQINGVVTTLMNTARVAREMGHDVTIIGPANFKYSFPCPTYPDIRLSIVTKSAVKNLILDSCPDRIHIATEGPIGIQAVRACEEIGLKFTTSYHTKFPEYLNKRVPLINPEWVYAFLRRFHKNSGDILVTTESMKRELISHGFQNNITVWSRGADFSLFDIDLAKKLNKKLRLLYVGRVSIEKNIEAFLDLRIVATKVVVGDGPYLETLKKKYQNDKDILFLGKMTGKDLVDQYQRANVFVFPSKTDTFGIVMIEAAACGTPVAAFDVTGPIDFIEFGVNGYCSPNLIDAVRSAITIKDFRKCSDYTKQNFSWEASTKTFLNSIIRVVK